MFLKVNKRKINTYCHIGESGQMVQTGIVYTLSLAESRRLGSSVKQTGLATLGSYTLKEYEPIKYTYGINALGMSVKKPSVKSYDVLDGMSFRKVKPESTVRFYHTFIRNLQAAVDKLSIPQEQIKHYCNQVMQIIPLYSQEDYKIYMKEQVKEILKREVTANKPEGFQKLLAGSAGYDIYDYVSPDSDGVLIGYRNRLSIHVDYDFKLS